MTSAKRYICLMMATVCALIGATDASAEFRYAGVAGVNLTDLVFKQDLVSVSQTVGVQAGVQGELMFPGIGFGIDIGLIYNQMGAKVNLGEKKIWASQGYGNERIYLHYIQIPLHLRFKWTRMNGLEDYIAPFVYGGPDFTIGVGHSKCHAIDFSGGELGLTAGVGAELWRRWQISGSYTWGMTYALKTKLLDNFSARNREWAVRVAYFF